jgi:hypothetical protein
MFPLVAVSPVSERASKRKFLSRIVFAYRSWRQCLSLIAAQVCDNESHGAIHAHEAIDALASKGTRRSQPWKTFGSKSFEWWLGT